MEVQVEDVAGAGDGDFEVDKRLPFGLEVGKHRDADVPQHHRLVVGAGEQVGRVGGVEEEAVDVLFVTLEQRDAEELIGLEKLDITLVDDDGIIRGKLNVRKGRRRSGLTSTTRPFEKCGMKK